MYLVRGSCYGPMMEDTFTVDLDSHLPALLFSVHSKLGAHALRECAQPHGLDLYQYRALLVLAREGPATSDRVADRIAMDRVQTRLAIVRMEMAGYVMLEPAETAAAPVVRLTPDGRALQDRLAEFCNARQARLMQAFSRRDGQKLAELLRQLDAEVTLMLAEGGGAEPVTAAG